MKMIETPSSVKAAEVRSRESVQLQQPAKMRCQFLQEVRDSYIVVDLTGHFFGRSRGCSGWAEIEKAKLFLLFPIAIIVNSRIIDVSR
jgi:hypothetical protein